MGKVEKPVLEPFLEVEEFELAPASFSSLVRGERGEEAAKQGLDGEEQSRHLVRGERGEEAAKQGLVGEKRGGRLAGEGDAALLRRSWRATSRAV